MLPRTLGCLLWALGMASAPGASARPPQARPPAAAPADKIHVLDGSTVLSLSELQVHVSNFGMIGSRHSVTSTYSDAPSAQWPAGSGVEYLFSAGLWIGGVLYGEPRVSTGEYEHELRPAPDPVDTMYESRYGTVVRPAPGPARAGARIYEADADDDGDGRRDEDPLNGRDDDGDGLVDEDFEQLGSQMLVCTYRDDAPLIREEYPDHRPLSVEVVQTAYCWEEDHIDDFVVLRFDVTNVGTAVIDRLRLGFFADPDIGHRDNNEAGVDDLAARFRGAARAPDGRYEAVDVAYMYDGGVRDHVPGYFGVMFLGETSLRRSIANVQYYSGRQAYAFGGDPTNDAERYAELGRTRSDADISPRRTADYRMLLSNGEFYALAPGRTATLEVALVVGDGLEGLLETCAQVRQIRGGRWYDLDVDYATGLRGRETLVCLEDMGFSLRDFDASPLHEQDPDFYDHTGCVPDHLLHFLRPEDLEELPDGRHCIWVNADTCEECLHARGIPCTKADFERHWHCDEPYATPDELVGCTGIYGRETGVRWVTDMPPPPPPLRVWARNRAVHVYWRDDPETTPDEVHGQIDFEGYGVWRADDWDRPPGASARLGPASSLWHLLAKYDVPSFIVRPSGLQVGSGRDTLALGAETGLEAIRYRPACLDDPAFLGLEAAVTALLDDPELRAGSRLPSVRDARGVVRPGLEPLVPWEHAPAVLDTFFWATPWTDPEGGAASKRSLGFYEYVDRTPKNGFLYFYAVTCFDRAMLVTYSDTLAVGPGLEGDPAAMFAMARPGTDADTLEDLAAHGPDIYVYPNPATRASLDEFQALHPNADDPTGRRVMFANLPACRSRIEIYSLNGDRVQTLDHDGGTGFGEASWNLVSRNGQEVASGLYLYVVRPQGAGFRDFVGKFVVIR
ncbi:MAG TPA: hypothetical protein P5571_01145 [Candidatus Krumholzibacteria bacterium]|nr:hypothetical protein [Candidatus Krumholzibacteria bacterium]